MAISNAADPFELSDKKRALLQLLLEQEGLDSCAVQAVSIPKRPAGSPPVLSYSQQRLWFLDQLEPGSAAYNIPTAIRLEGSVDVPILGQCLNKVISRHEVLRTNYQTIAGQPVPVINYQSNLQLPIIDLSHLSKVYQEREVNRLAIQESRRPFSISRDPLLRAHLLRLGPEEHILLITMHHIVSDRWSLGILAQEFSALYTASVQKTGDPLADLPIQYADFAIWQQEWLQGEKWEKQLSFWKKQLFGELPVLELPTDTPPLPIQSFHGDRKSATLPVDLSQALIHLSQKTETTLFMVFLAAFNTLLFRLTGQEDILLGTPVAGRSRPELERLVGLFLNTLVLRTDLSGDPSFRELLARIKETALAAYSNQDLPFEKLVEELQPRRSLSRNPLFDVLINFSDQPIPRTQIPGLTLEQLEIGEPESKFWMTLYITQDGTTINLELVYRSDLFTPERIDCILQQFQFLLGQIAAKPDVSITSYSLVTPDSRSRLPQPEIVIAEQPQVLITDQIAGWASQTPGQPAVCHGRRTWSYHDLHSKAIDIALHLVEMGQKAGEPVAITGFRSYGLVVSMVGVLLSGGVLLTIDPQLPIKRQKQMLEEAGVKFLIRTGTDQPFGDDTLVDRIGMKIFSVDPNTGKPWQAYLISSKNTHLPAVTPEDAAYLFFTSGTLGVPKGVLGNHKGLSHFLAWQRETFSVGPGDRSAQLTGLSFDVVLRDIFLPLTSGATLFLPDPEDGLEPQKVLAWLEKEKITILHTVPAVVHNWLLDIPDKLALNHLRWAFFAGEPLTNSLIQCFRQILPETAGIINLYGPTETSLAKFYYRVPTQPHPGIQPVSLPLPQTQGLILSERQQLCGIGEPGEIVIRTPYRTLGYINAPEEMRNRFVKNPFRDEDQDILYFTGDIGRYRLDGSIEILGRKDHQVKIHGVRVEPEEVTAVLLQHPQVKSGIVVSKKDSKEQYHLIAYLVASQPATVTVTDLRMHFAERLPAAMIPGVFVFLGHLPLNANGKVDRSALPEPLQTVDKPERQLTAPKDPIEGRLVEIWRSLLGIETVGTREDFFALGGHSMLAVRMFVQIQDAFGTNLPLTSLFREATIEHLAALIRQQIGMSSWSSLVKIQPHGDKRPFYCVHGITGDVFWFGELSKYMSPDQPFWGLQSKGVDSVQDPLSDIESMAAHYIREVRRHQPEGPYYIGGYSYGGTVAFEMARQLEAQGQEVALLAILDHATPKSGYFQYKLSFGLIVHILKNLPYRLSDILHLSPSEFLARLKRKSRILQKRILKLPNSPDPQPISQAGDVVDNAAQLPGHIQKLIQMNYRAIHEYEPQKYSGKLTLLRARGGRLICSHNLEMGWGNLAEGGVEVRMIAGSHLRIFQEPYIRILAEELQACLDEAQA